MDAEDVRRAIYRISHEILESTRGAQNLVLAGIPTRGVLLSSRIADCISSLENRLPSVIELDVASYRDDRVRVDPVTQPAAIVEGLTVVVVDDVLCTGRTVRCALDALVDLGRPAAVRLAVLCDRGHRELPIRADFVGKNLPTKTSEFVRVCLSELDGADVVEIYG